MEPQPTEGPLERHARRWRWPMRGLALLSLALFLYWAIGYIRGEPDRYHNQHSRGMLLTLAMFVQAVAPEFKLKTAGWVLMGLSMALLAAVFWLSF